MANNWLIEQSVHLDRGAATPMVWPNALMLSGDSEAHTWETRVYEDGAAFDMTGGAVTGYFVRADGNTVVVQGSITGNLASVTLAQACYAVAGDVKGVLRLSTGTKVITLSVLILRVRNDLTDVLIDPGEVIPSLDELLAQIVAMEAATAAANEAAAAADTATGLATTAKENADTASAAANDAAALANTKAGLADSAATLANEKAALADSKATLANDKAVLADSKATLADTATTNANNAKDAALAAKVSTEAATVIALATPNANGNWTKDSKNPLPFYPAFSAPLYFRREGVFSQAGSGDPSPTNIRAITPFMASGAQIALRNSGKNLLPYPYASGASKVMAGITFTANSDGSVTINGTASGPASYAFISLTGSYETQLALGRGKYIMHPLTIATNITLSGAIRVDSGATRVALSVPLLVEITNDTSRVDFSIQVATGVVASNVKVYPQLEIGSVPTAYEPYVGSLATLTAPAEIASGWIDNKGEGQATWARVVLGTINIASVVTNTNTARFDITALLTGSKSSVTDKVCSHFLVANNSDDAEHAKGTTNTGLESAFIIWINKARMAGWSDAWSDADKKTAFQTWITGQVTAGTPVTIVYHLATPTALTPVSASLNSIPATDLAVERLNVFTSSLGGILTYPKNKVRTDRILRNSQLWRKTAAGNPVSIYPAPETPLAVKVTGTYTQTGTGEPSPSNIRAISPWLAKDAVVAVKRTGKNLFDRYSCTRESIDASGNITSNSALLLSPYRRVAPTIAVSLVSSVGGAGIRIAFYDANYTFISRSLPANGAVLSIANAVFIRVCIDDTVSAYLTGVQVESNSVATPYEPYIGDDISLIAPQEIAAGWMDNEGAGQGTWAKLIMNGTESWSFYSSTPEWDTILTDCFQLLEANLPNVVLGYATSVCSHFKNIAYNKPFIPATSVSGEYSDHPTMKNKFFSWGDGTKTLQNWKDYLAAQYAAGTPVTLYYQVLTPVTLVPTIAPLIAIPQLDRITPRINVVTATPTVSAEVTYAKSPIRESDELTAAIAAIA